ncbi:hypothetical protein M1466_03110 [Candidatus Dependentiae bacterium]|nr:hypothetical protein [Candidatus Dependentiae bacterium]
MKNNTFRFIAALLLSLVLPSMDAGVYVLVDLPASMAAVVAAAQQQLQKGLEEYNASHGTAFLFEPTQFSPHLSVAFVSQEPLSVQAAAAKFPAIEAVLQDIIQNNQGSIDITEAVQQAMLEFWPGKFTMTFAGAPRKNFINVVLKFAMHDTLAQQIRNGLQEHYGIKQAFPFSAHISLGRMYQQDDAPVVIQEIPAFTMPQLSEPIELNTVKLKGHDGSEVAFSL